MRKFFLIFLCAALAFSCTREIPETVSGPVAQTGPAAGADVRGQDVEELGFQPGVALVYVDEATAERIEKGTAVQDLVHDLDVTGAERLFPDAGEWEPRTRREGLHRWYVVNYDRTVTLARAKTVLEAVPGVQLVEPSRIIRRAVSINDTYWSQMWGMNNLDYPGYDVNCKPVWDTYTMGSPNVTVAVVDGGIQMDHPDLRANIASSGHYNYVRGNTNISQHMHGTHVAGTIGAVNNNGIGVTGIAGGNASAGKPGIKLLSLQVFETQDNGYDATASDFNRALKEAADKGAVISQNSWGFNFDFNDNGYLEDNELSYARRAHENPERSFVQAVDYFNKYAGCDNSGRQLSTSPMKGGVVIFAAGNENVPYGAPGNYEGCVSVGAIAQNGSKASFSNYGDWVDICAPGVSVPSTYINSRYVSMSGTSMACPHVSGVAALIVSYFGGQGFTADELRVRLLTGARTIGASSGSRPIGPLVDAWGSFNMNAQGGVPDPVTDVTVSPVGHNLRVDFTASGAYGYMILAARQKSALTNADLQNPSDNLIVVNRLASAAETQGVPLSVTLAGLTPSADYYVAVVAYSYDKKFSALSGIVQTRTAENQKPVIDIQDYPATGFQFRHHEIVSLPVVCSDPDGDAITVSFRTTGRATLESNTGSEGLFNFKLMCPLTNAGRYTATIEAKDEVGAVAIRGILYEVLPNTAPMATKEIRPVLLEEKGQEMTLSLAEYFSDPDGEELFFKVASMNPDIVEASLTEEGELLVKAVSQGVCKVSISAEDHAGERVNQQLTLLVRLEGTPEVFLSGNTVLSDGAVTLVPGLEEASLEVRIVSASGVVVYSYTGVHSASSPLTLDLSALAPGIYTVEVTYKGETYTYTIVKR